MHYFASSSHGISFYHLLSYCYFHSAARSRLCTMRLVTAISQQMNHSSLTNILGPKLPIFCSSSNPRALALATDPRSYNQKPMCHKTFTIFFSAFFRPFQPCKKSHCTLSENPMPECSFHPLLITSIPKTKRRNPRT